MNTMHYINDISFCIMYFIEMMKTKKYINIH